MASSSGSKSRTEKWSQKEGSTIDVSSSISIEMGEEQNKKPEKKEQPRWMTESTVQGAEADGPTLVSPHNAELTLALLNCQSDSLFFIHLKLELLTQFPASNDEKYFQIELSAKPSFYL